MLRKIMFGLIVSLAASAFSPAYGLNTGEKLLFEKNTLYQYIAVVDDTVKRERYLRNNRRDLAQGGMSLDTPEKLLFEFTRMAFISLAFLDREPKDVLFVGLGIGAMPQYFNRHYPDANVDIAEIDVDVLDAAEKYFNFRENPKMKVHVTDGRTFVKRSKKKYDLIVLDAYQNDYIPFHLTTLEFLNEVKARLKDDGVVVSNILSPFRNKFFDSMVMTYKKAFPHLYVFKGKKSNNFIFVATPSKQEKTIGAVAGRAKKIETARKLDIDLSGIASSLESSKGYEWEAAKVLTDDFAPVNLYQHQKSGK